MLKVCYPKYLMYCYSLMISGRNRGTDILTRGKRMPPLSMKYKLNLTYNCDACNVCMTFRKEKLLCFA